MRIIIARVGNNETIRFAAEEFARYLKMMDKNLLVDERAYDTYDATCLTLYGSVSLCRNGVMMMKFRSQ